MVLKTMNQRLASAGLLFVCSLHLGSCSLSEGTGTKIGVPHRQQTQPNFCAAASVLMWRLYDGNSNISQNEIFDWMANNVPVEACGPNLGSNALGVALAVNHFTNAYDAYWDNDFSVPFEAFLSRQITSIDSRVPVIAVFRDDHTVVVNGGKWHREGGYQIWDFVYYHDPGKSFGNSRLQATQWMDFVCPGFGTYCNQIVSASAVAHAVQYLGNWGTTTLPAGGGYNPSGTWPPAH